MTEPIETLTKIIDALMEFVYNEDDFSVDELTTRLVPVVLKLSETIKLLDKGTPS